MDYLNVKTVVIGSGVAGIACGINLLRNNYDDFVVFEAQDRIGGRVCTVDFNKSYLEMGAQVR
jgi:monoamine oxidase